MSGVSDQRAEALLRPAHEASYRLPAGFAGFAARLTIDSTGSSVGVTIRSPRDVAIDPVDQGPDPAVEEDWAWARRELASMAGHRWPTNYAERDGRWQKRLEEAQANAAGEFVSFVDDPYRSSYRVLDGHLSEVHRTAGDVRFAIVIGTRTEVTDGRYLPTAFTVYNWRLDESGHASGLERVDSYLDSYVEVAGSWLPAGRRVTSGDATGLSTRQLVLTGHVLLDA